MKRASTKKDKVTGVRFSASLLAKIMQAAKKERITFSEFVRIAVLQSLEQRSRVKP